MQAVPDGLVKHRETPLPLEDLDAWLKDDPEAYSAKQSYYQTSAYRWEKWVSAEEIASRVKRDKDIGTLLRIIPRGRGISGRVQEAENHRDRGERQDQGRPGAGEARRSPEHPLYHEAAPRPRTGTRSITSSPAAAGGTGSASTKAAPLAWPPPVSPRKESSNGTIPGPSLPTTASDAGREKIRKDRLLLRLRHAGDELPLHEDNHRNGRHHREQGRRHNDLPLDLGVGHREHSVDADEERVILLLRRN